MLRTAGSSTKNLDTSETVLKTLHLVVVMVFHTSAESVVRNVIVTGVVRRVIWKKKCFAKKRGEPRSNGNPHNRNATANSTTESAGTAEEVFAGMAFCQEINEVNSVG